MSNATLWVGAAVALLVCQAPLLLALVRSRPMGALVALQQATVVTVLVLVSITEAIRRSAFFDLGLALAMLAPASGLLFARFLERWE